MAGESTSNGLYLRTFGGAALLDDERRDLKLPRKQLALLVLLRLLPPERFNRNELERLLWFNVPGDPANSLAQALIPLRGYFPGISKGKGTLEWLTRDALACDVDLLLAGENDPAARRAAVSAYRGAFLKGFSNARRPEAGEEEFRHWVNLQQERYETLFRKLVKEEAEDAAENEAWGDLEALARHALDVDRHWQWAHAQLIRGLAGTGHADAARRHYESVLSTLRSETEDGEEVEIEPALAEAYERIGEWAAAAAAERSRANTSHQPDTADDPAIQPAGGADTHPEVPAPEPAIKAPQTLSVPSTRGGRWKRRPVGWLAAGGVALLLLFAAVLHGRQPPARRQPGESTPVAAARLAPLCEPGQARGTLVEQDWKADPVNVVSPGMHFTTVWHLQNTGDCAWPASLRMHRLGPKPLSISDRDVPAQKPVQPGDTIQFPAPMVAPADTGQFGETWELLDETGRPVPIGPGRGTLAAGIRVLDGPPPLCAPGEVRVAELSRAYTNDTRLKPGERFTYEWTLANRAPGCSLGPGYALRFVSASPQRMSDPAVVEVPITEPVVPSFGYSFEIPMRAPLKPGSYAEEWSLVYRHHTTVPVQDFRTIGLRLAVRDDTTAVPEVAFCRRGEYAIAWINTERVADKTVILAGGRYLKKWTLANRGRCTWQPGMRLHYVGGEGGTRAGPPFDIPVTRPVAPREQFTFTIPVRVPRHGTRYVEKWSAIDPFGDTVRISLTKAIWTEVIVGR